MITAGTRDKTGGPPGKKIQRAALGVQGALCILLFIVSGCVHARESAHRPTDIDPKQATAGFWFDKPAIDGVVSSNFRRLWDAAAHSVRNRRFEIDQQDERLGVMTTLPLSAQQIWEVWRDDLPHVKDQLRDTIAEYRQTVRFDFEKLPDGAYQVTPKVVLERHAQREHRVTSAQNPYEVFAVNVQQNEDMSIDQPVTPSDYWYATGRDYALERDLAADIRHRLAH